MNDDDTTTVTRHVDFDAGHRVALYGSRCRPPHGHHYRLEVTFGGDVASDDDPETPGEARSVAWLDDLRTTFDTAFIADQDDDTLLGAFSDRCLPIEDQPRLALVPGPPTADNLARFFGEQIEARIGYYHRRLRIVQVVLWQTTDYKATWRPVPETK